MGRYIVGISGASGARLSVKLIQELLCQGHDVDVVLTAPAVQAIIHEVNGVRSKRDFQEIFSPQDRITFHNNADIGCTIASGSCSAQGMVIIPCSMSTVAAISIGLADNLLRRAADVSIKEKRPLVLVPREAPMHAIHLQNLAKLSSMGVTIFPPVPLWYLKPKTIDDLEDDLVGKILSSLGVINSLERTWEGL